MFGYSLLSRTQLATSIYLLLYLQVLKTASAPSEPGASSPATLSYQELPSGPSSPGLLGQQLAELSYNATEGVEDLLQRAAEEIEQSFESTSAPVTEVDESKPSKESEVEVKGFGFGFVAQEAPSRSQVAEASSSFVEVAAGTEEEAPPAIGKAFEARQASREAAAAEVPESRPRAKAMLETEPTMPAMRSAPEAETSGNAGDEFEGQGVCKHGYLCMHAPLIPDQQSLCKR